MTKPDGSVIIDTKLNTGGFSKGASSLKSQFSSLTSSVGKLGAAIGAAFSVKAIVDFSKKALELGSDLQEVQNVVNVTFTTMNEQINEFARNAAKTAGLSETMAKKYAGTFGAMSKSFGFTEEEAYGMSTALTQLTGDVASFYNLTQDVSYTKLKSVFTGETESLKDLGVVMTQTALDDYALRKGLGKTTQQMSEQEKVALRYSFVLDQLAGASGDFVRTQDGWANQTRILKLQTESLMATFGQGLINVLTPSLKMLNTMIGKLQEFADAFKQVTEALFGNASSDSSGGVAGSLGSAAENAGELEDNITDAGKAAKKALAGFDEINSITGSSGEENGTKSFDLQTNIAGSNIPVNVDVKATVTDEVTPKIHGIISNIKNDLTSLSLHLSTFLSPAISSWGGSFADLMQNGLKPFASYLAEDFAPKVGSAMSDMAPVVAETIGNVAISLANLQTNAIAPLMNYILSDFYPNIGRSFTNSLLPIFKDVLPTHLQLLSLDFFNMSLAAEKSCVWIQQGFERVKNVFADMARDLLHTWLQYGEPIMQGFVDFKEGLWKTFWDIYNNIIDPVLTNAGKMLDWLWDEHLEPLWNEFTLFLASLIENALSLWNKTLKPIIDWLVSALSPTITWIINAIVDGVALVVAWFSDAVKTSMKSLRGFIDFIVGIFTLDFEKAWNGVKTIFESIWDGIKSTFTGVVNGIIWVINQLIGAVYSGIAGTVNAWSGTIEKLGGLFGKEWNISLPTNPPKIPYLAKGAVIPPRSPFYAVLGDQRHGRNLEAPEGLIRQIMREELENMGINVEVENKISFEGELAQLARLLKPAIDTETRRRGGSLAKGTGI